MKKTLDEMLASFDPKLHGGEFPTPADQQARDEIERLEDRKSRRAQYVDRLSRLREISKLYPDAPEDSGSYTQQAEKNQNKIK